jgi:hypothetical protein
MQKIVRKMVLPAGDERLGIPPPVMPILPGKWSIRLIQPGTDDVKVVHRWMHQEHVKIVMRKDWSLEEWNDEIREQVEDDFSRPYIVGYDGVDGGYIELYRAQRDVLSRTLEVDRFDIGLHGAIGAVEALNQGYAFRFWLALLEGVFLSDAACGRVFSDPTASNYIVRKLDEKVCEVTGGRFLGEVQLPHKLAAVYAYEREPFMKMREARNERRQSTAEKQAN